MNIDDLIVHLCFAFSKAFRIVIFGLLLATGVALPAGENTLKARGGECLMYAMSLWGDAYKARTPGFSLDLQVESEAKAMQDLADGSCQVAMLARNALPEELTAFRIKWGYLPTRVAVAMDALIVVVSKDNPVKAIHIEEVDATYNANRAMGWPKDVLALNLFKVTDLMPPAEVSIR